MLWEKLLILSLFIGNSTVKELDRKAAYSLMRGDFRVAMEICLWAFLCVYLSVKKFCIGQI